MSLTSLIPLPYRWLMMAGFAAALVGFGFVKGISHEEVKWNKSTAAIVAADQKALLTRIADNARIKTKQDADNATINKDKDAQIASLNARLAATPRLRKPSFCGGPTTTEQTTGTSGSNAADTTSGLLSPEMDGRIKALILETEAVAATGRACQAFNRDNGMGN